MIVDLRNIEAFTNVAYLPYFNSKKRYEVFYGGAGSGKSKFVGQKVLIKCLTEANHKFLVIRKVANTLRNSCFALICAYISAWNLEPYFKINKTDMQITCTITNSTILFKGIDDSEKIKSIDGITSIWIEEASELSFDDFTQLDLRLRGITAVNKQIILSFNPISAEHWLKKRFFDYKSDDVSVLKTTYLDNRFLDETYKGVLESLKETNPAYYKVYCLGEWGVLDGRVYENYKIVNEIPSECELSVYGVDFGFNHPSAVVLVCFDSVDLYVKELFYKSGYTSAHLIQELKRDYPYLLNLQGFFEIAEPDKLQEFREAGFIVNPAKKSIIDGINEVKKYHLHISADSTNLIKELNNYTWAKNKDGSAIDVPIDDYNHALDAMRYAVYSLAKPAKKVSYLRDFTEVDNVW